MTGKLRELWEFLYENVSITIIPSTRYKTRSIRLRIMIFIIMIVVIVGAVGTLAYLTHYYRTNYLETREEYSEFRERINYEEIKEENSLLKKELYTLSRETEALTESLKELKDYNSDIKMLIADTADNTTQDEEDINIQFTPLLTYNQSLLQQGRPVGGREFNLYYQKPEKVIVEMQKNINYLKEEISVQEKELAKLEGDVEKYNAKKAATPDIWPVADRGEGYISDEFGWRIHPLTNKQEFHEGMDIAVWYNTPVLAAADGIVKYVGWYAGYGYLIKIDHEFGYMTYYAHLNKFKVKVGQKVKKGQVIALSGNSGRSTGPHLHYEVRVNNIPQNPREYIGRKN